MSTSLEYGVISGELIIKTLNDSLSRKRINLLT